MKFRASTSSSQTAGPGSPSRQVALCRMLVGHLGQARLASVLCARPGLTLNQSQRLKCVLITNKAKWTSACLCVCTLDCEEERP